MRDADRGGRLRHPVEVDQIGARAFAVGVADDEGFVDRMPPVLFEKLQERRLAQTRNEDWLVVIQEAHVDEGALQVEQHQHVDRPARKAGQGGKRAGLEHIARLGPAGVQKAVDPLVVQRLAQRVGWKDQGRDAVTRAGVGSRNRNRQAEPQQGKDHAHASRIGA
jgi:hypothetical protein